MSSHMTTGWLQSVHRLLQSWGQGSSGCVQCLLSCTSQLEGEMSSKLIYVGKNESTMSLLTHCWINYNSMEVTFSLYIN